jgi:hypothetical protein
MPEGNHEHTLEVLWTNGTYVLVQCTDPACDYRDHLLVKEVSKHK